MKNQALYDRLLVKRLDGESSAKAGSLVPDVAKSQEGRVIATSRGRVLDDGDPGGPDVALGDRVLFARHAGKEFRIDGQAHFIIREDDVLAVLK